MSRGVISAALLVAALAFADVAGAQAAPAVKRSPPRQRQIICKGAQIPAGWILVDDLRETTMCGGSNAAVVNSYNVWAIEKFEGAPVGTTLFVCANNPIPVGWTMVDVYRDKSVCGHPEDLYAVNVKVIRRNK
jgi:hypothetical protein